MDEKDIPPPPMPEYMKGHDVDRDIASETEESADPLEEQSTEDIKREFLQAGDEEENPDDLMLEPEVVAQEDPLTEEKPLAEMAEHPEIIVEEDPVREIYQDKAGQPAEQPAEEISATENASPEFEQASMPDPGQPMPEPVSVEAIPKPPVAEETAEQEEALAAVEEKLEEAEQVAEEIAEGVRKPSAKTPFKPGMYKFEEKCTMYKEPRSLSAEAGSIPAGRKLWIDGHDENWLKAYKKSGAVYISADCLQ